MRGSCAIIATVVIKSDVIAVSTRGALVDASNFHGASRSSLNRRVKVRTFPFRDALNRRETSAGRVTAVSFFIVGRLARLVVLAIAHNASRRNM